MQPFAHREFDTAMYMAAGIRALALTSGSTTNTYNTANGGASIDSWNGGRMFPRKLLVVVNVGTVSGTGTLTVSLRDSATSMGNATGDAGTDLCATLTNITAVGQYYAEIKLDRPFPGAADASSYIQRYHSIRAVAASCNFTFSVDCFYSFADGKNPSQDSTELTVTYNDPS